MRRKSILTRTVGRVLEYGTKAFQTFVDLHNVQTIPGTRTIIIVDIHQVGSSCGFSVPLYKFEDYRTILNRFFATKDRKFNEGNAEESIDKYWAYKNAWSMDGLPGLQRAMKVGKLENVAPIKKMVGPLAPVRYSFEQGYSATHVVFLVLASFFLGAVMTRYAASLPLVPVW